MPLRGHNSGAVRARELFKRSRDSASPAVCNKKKFFQQDLASLVVCNEKYAVTICIQNKRPSSLYWLIADGGLPPKSSAGLLECNLIMFQLHKLVNKSSLFWTQNIKQEKEKISQTLSCPVSFKNFAPKKNRSHVALPERNSGAESSRKLFKGLKDSKSCSSQ